MIDSLACLLLCVAITVLLITDNGFVINVLQMPAIEEAARSLYFDFANFFLVIKLKILVEGKISCP